MSEDHSESIDGGFDGGINDMLTERTTEERNIMERLIDNLTLEDVRWTLVRFNAFKSFVADLTTICRHRSPCVDKFNASYKHIPATAYPVWDRYVTVITDWFNENKNLDDVLKLTPLRITSVVYIDWSTLRELTSTKSISEKLHLVENVFKRKDDIFLVAYDIYGAAHFQAAFVKYERLFVDKSFDDLLDEVVNKTELQVTLKSLAATLTRVIEAFKSDGVLDFSKLMSGQMPIMPLLMNLMKSFGVGL